MLAVVFCRYAPRLFARQLRGNALFKQEKGGVFCAVWSVPRLNKGNSLERVFSEVRAEEI
jgi:hypothetical protein